MTIRAELDNMRERVNAATEGPWETRCPPGGYAWIAAENYPHKIANVTAVVASRIDPPDAEFIAHARTDLPRLLDAVEKVLEVLETEAEAAAKNRLAIDQRDPNMDSGTVAMLSGLVLGRLQTTELIRRAITTALEGK